MRTASTSKHPSTVRRTALVLLGLMLAGLAHALEPESAVVIGSVSAPGGSLPAAAHVMATPAGGGDPVFAGIDGDFLFAFDPMPPGAYRFEIALPGEVLPYAAGSEKVRIVAGATLLRLGVEQGESDDTEGGRTRRDKRAKREKREKDDDTGDERTRRDKRTTRTTRVMAWSVIGGVVASALLCEAADCFGRDETDSPILP